MSLRVAPQHHRTLPVFARAGVIAIMVIGGLALDEMIPQMLSVGVFYVAAVLTGFWFPRPSAPLALALLATFLIVIAYWITTPDIGTVREVWTNRLLSIGTVWLTSFFVRYIRVLQERLRQQIEITDSLAREISHRVGNSLQIVASFLRLQASGSGSAELRQFLDVASARVMAIGRIERLLSHSGSAFAVNSREFLASLIEDVRTNLHDRDRLAITATADSVELSSSLAIPLGACLIELINNALKHAFQEESKGTIEARFAASSARFTVELEDDGIGIGETGRKGFGTRNVAALARLMCATISQEPAHPSAARPGTLWRLAIPRQ